MSPSGITLPMYFFTRSGYSCTASEMDMKTTPAFRRSSLKVVAMETESKTASTATFASLFCSVRGIPSLSKVFSSSGSTSSRLCFFSFCLGSE